MNIIGQSVSFGGSGGKITDLPDFTYTGESAVMPASNYGLAGDYKVLELRTSGTLTFAKKFKADVFLVGGGSGGARGHGGSGGYTQTFKNEEIKSEIEVIIGGGGTGSLTGSDGGATTFDALTANGGTLKAGGSGSGGTGTMNETGIAGASDGNSTSTASGQGSTTRAFGETGATLYAGGGGGPGNYYSWGGEGGAGGGGRGGNATTNNNIGTGATNTGGGGGGGVNDGSSSRYPGANGGSGIVLMRIAQN